MFKIRQAVHTHQNINTYINHNHDNMSNFTLQHDTNLHIQHTGKRDNKNINRQRKSDTLGTIYQSESTFGHVLRRWKVCSCFFF